MAKHWAIASWAIVFLIPVSSPAGTGGDSQICIAFEGSDPLLVGRSQQITVVHWGACGCGDAYDLVRGDLNVLVGDCDHDGDPGDCAAGNFQNALNAITPSSDVCMLNDSGTGEVPDARHDPVPGRGEFYLMRQVSGCGEDDSYGIGWPPRDRDFGIGTANGACPQ